MQTIHQCPLCGGSSLDSRGTIFHPSPARVAGVEIDLHGLEFHLMQCRDCGFQFKSPMIPSDKLLACYAAASDDHWGMQVDPRQRNFDLLANTINQFAQGKRILDVGCFNGAFLDYMGGAWNRFGVEPSHAARNVAAERGVKILGDTLDDIDQTETFDVITSFDVIEHVVEPVPFFTRIRQHLKPGGIFVATSGDTDAISWRLQKARYWYCSYLPEHVSFYNRQSLDYAARHHQMRTVHHSHMSHKRTSMATRLKEAAVGTSYAALLRAGWLGLPNLKKKFATRGGSSWASATDHFIHVMQRSLDPTPGEKEDVRVESELKSTLSNAKLSNAKVRNAKVRNA